jgi:hypothetical protein
LQIAAPAAERCAIGCISFDLWILRIRIVSICALPDRRCSGLESFLYDHRENFLGHALIDSS